MKAPALFIMFSGLLAAPLILLQKDFALYAISADLTSRAAFSLMAAFRTYFHPHFAPRSQAAHQTSTFIIFLIAFCQLHSGSYTSLVLLEFASSSDET